MYESRILMPETEILRETPWSRRIRGQNSVSKELQGDCWQWKANGQSSKGDNCSFRHDISRRAKITQPNPSPSSSTRQNERNASRTRSPSGKSPSGRMFRLPCKDYSKLVAPNHSMKNGILRNACSTSRKNGCRLGEKCSCAHRQVEEQPSKRSSNNADKCCCHAEEAWVVR